MSLVSIAGGATGTGTFTVLAPSTNTNRTITLPDETGTVVSTGSTAVVTPAMLTQPLTLGTAVPTTSGTSVDFTGIPSYAKRITIILNGVSTNSSNTFLVQVGNGTIVTTGYETVRGQINGTSPTTTAATNAIAYWAVLSATSAHYGHIVLTTVGSNIWVSSYSIGQGTTLIAAYGGGGITLAGALDRVRLTTSGGDTFDAGSFNILYE